MAKYGSDDLKIEVDNSGGALVDMSDYIDEINDVNIEALLQEGHTFGDAWVEQLFTGIKRVEDVVLSGFYDDAASTGPDVIFNAISDTRSVKITWGGSKTTEFEAVIRIYTRSPTRGELTRFSVTLAPTGAVTEA